MHNRYSFRPARTIVYTSISQERSWGCEHPIGDPWGGPAFGEKNKGGFFSSGYWAGGGIVNSVVELVKDPINYTNERLKELDKTVIQPVGNGLEKVGQAIASDPENFALMLAAAATQQWYIVAAMAMVISAGKGNDWDKVLTDGAIAGATSFVAVEGSGMLMESMKVTANGATSYAIAGTEISKSTATVIANTASYTASSTVSAAATGKNVGEAALRGAITGGLISGVQSVDILKDFSAAIDSVAAKGVGPAITNAISGAAGTMLSGIVTGKDMSTQAGMALVGGAVSGLTAAIKISGDFFSNNAAESLDLVYDDYGPRNDTRSVAEYLTDKLGPVGAGLVTNTVTSVLTSTFTKGDPSAFLAQQIMGNLTQSIKNAFDPNFKARYVDPLSGFMSEAEDAAKEYNDAANAQNALGERINGNITSYNNRISALNPLYSERNSLVDQYNGMTSANSTQAQADELRGRISALDTRIANEVSSINSFYQSGIIDLQGQYATLKSQTDAAQNNYTSISEVLGEKAVPLTKYINDTTKQMALDTAKTLDPDFNPDEYRTLNGLSSTDDVGAHYLSTGKDKGLFTNFESAQGALESAQFKAVDALARAQGYSGGAISLPPSMYNDALDKITSFYGNNLKALEGFTVDSFSQQIKLPATAVLPMWDSESKELTVAKVIFNEQTNQEQLVNITTKLPEGKAAATASQILGGQASMVRGSDGNFYWTVGNDQSSAMIYDASAGQMVKAVMSPRLESAPAGATNVSYNEDGSVAGYTGADGVYKTTITGVLDDNPNDVDVEVTAKRASSDLDDADPLVQMYTYAAVPDGIAANFNVKGIVNASKDIVNYMQQDASDIQKLQISTIVKSAGSVMQDVGTVLGDLSVTIGLSKTNNSTLADLGKQLQGLADAKTPEQYKTAMADIKAMRDAAKGSDIVGVNAAIAEKYPDLVGVSVFGGELFEEVIQSGIGKAAFVAGGALAATLGAPALISGAIATAAGIGTSMAMDFAESYRGAKEDMYTRMYDVYKGKGYSDAQAAQMADAAATKAGVMNGVITSVINGATPGDLNKVLFGGKASPAQEAITNYFVDKVMSAAKVAAVEFGEGAVEGALQGAYNEALVYSVDPAKADYWKGISDSAMLEAVIGAPVAAGTYGIDNSLDIAQKTFTLANDQFSKAITNPNVVTMGELGAQFKQWGIPSDVTMQILPDILESNPNLTKFYATPQEYAAAIENGFGLTDTAQIYQIVDTKFNDQVTTSDEAQTALLDSGLKYVTAEDAAKSGAVGASTQDTANKINTYANQNMVSQAELEAASKQENYTFVQEELNKLIGRGVEADVIAKYVSEIDPKAVTTAEAKDYFQRLGYSNATAEEIAQFVKSVAETQVQEEVGAYVDPRQVTREEAVQFYADLNYTPTEAEIQQFIKHGKDIQEAQVQSDLGGYVDPRMVDKQEVKDMLQSLGLIVPATEADLARLSGQYMESELAGKANEAIPVVSANAIYNLVGSPMQNVDQSDLDYIKQIVAGNQAQDMSYDANKDGKVDIADQTLLEEQMAFQQNENIQETINPNTGITAWIDKTTGKEVFQPMISGGQWAPTGIYAALEQQKAQTAATAKAQAAQAKEAQQKNQFGQLVNMLFQAPDAAGQQVTVKTPDPAKINYIYDWSSVFATPSQASLMPSPYGATNTVMPMQPQQKQQAANQPLFQMASGFAGGGIVGGNDMEVGDGGSVDDLINILKGNSG